MEGKVLAMRKFIALIVLLMVPISLLAQPGRKDVNEGNKLFAQQKYDEAYNKYRNASIDDPNNPLIHYNLANALYKKKKYEDALKDYEKSLSAEDIQVQEKSYYNMGNTFYRMGKLLEAIAAYKQALKLNPDDEDAKYNLEFVRRKLKENSKKQPQNKQQQQNQRRDRHARRQPAMQRIVREKFKIRQQQQPKQRGF